jgi:hypothetical protein
MQKHKFGIMCRDALFVESLPDTPKHEKVCVDVLQLRRTGMHYVTCTSHGMQKHKISVMCPGALFVESTPVPPQLEKQCVEVSLPGRTGMHYVASKSH